MQFRPIFSPVIPSILTKGATYPISSADDIILCSGAAFTVTLPDATVSSNNKVFTIKKTDSSLANIITIATTSAQTINYGTSSPTTVTLNTQGELWQLCSDGANWQVMSHQTKTADVAYTPTITGWGSYSLINFTSHREYDRLVINGSVTPGNTSGVTLAQFTIGFNGTNSGISFSPTIIPSGLNVLVGEWASQNTSGLSAGFGPVFAAGATTVSTVYMGVAATTAAPLQPANTAQLGGTSNQLRVKLSIPISGWLD